jgi:hypothetical protein
VLTNRPAEKTSASWSIAHVGAVIVLSAITLTSAYAGGVIGLSCVGGGKSFNCAAMYATAGDPYVRIVPDGLSDSDKAQAAARDHKWQAHCHPTIERDSYGVARYQYSSPGCEYGLGTE